MINCYKTKQKSFFAPPKEKRGKIHLFSIGIPNFFLLTLIVFALIFYVIQTNTKATKGFVFKDLEYQLNSLREENQKLELEVSRSQSLVELEPKIKNLKLVKANDVVYLEINDAGLAKK